MLKQRKMDYTIMLRKAMKTDMGRCHLKMFTTEILKIEKQLAYFNKKEVA